MRLASKPRKVALAFEKERIKWKYRAGRTGGVLTVEVPLVEMHAAVVVE